MAQQQRKSSTKSKRAPVEDVPEEEFGTEEMEEDTDTSEATAYENSVDIVFMNRGPTKRGTSIQYGPQRVDAVVFGSLYVKGTDVDKYGEPEITVVATFPE